MTVRRLRLRPGVYCRTAADGSVTLLNGRRWAERLGPLTPRDDALLRALAAGEVAESDVDGLLNRLHRGGWLTVRYDLGERRLITVRPLGPQPPPPPVTAPVLSRFAVVRRDGGKLLLESPLSRAVVEVHDPAVLSLLLDPTAADPADPAVAAVILDALGRYGFLEGPADQKEEQWSPPELWFHARSRGGHHEQPLGATGWAAGRFPPEPPRRPPWPGESVPLPTPDPGGLELPLRDALAARRSVRVPAAEPLTVTQLGEFLHWAARVQRADPDVSWRPSPSGGARHALEIYAVVTAVDGLEPGLYHYDPHDHRLEPVPASAGARELLVRHATEAAGGSPPPQVLLILAARFGRTMLKYQGLGYALILKDLGALLQTMYLVATAMGLAPCALGSGDAALFARATGLDPLIEASVGEFMLSRAGG